MTKLNATLRVTFGSTLTATSHPNFTATSMASHSALFFALVLATLFPPTPPLAAQATHGSVRVQVRSDSGPVEAAEVRAGSVRALTNASGDARLDLPEGNARIEVRRLGYGTEVVEHRIVAGEETTVEVRLHVATLRVDGISVTSTRTGRRVQDEPIRVEIVDREEIEEKMLMRPGNIVMLLNETGGLRVQVTSPSLGAANIRIQGMRGRYTQLLADGLPLYGGQAGAIGPMQIPPVDLGQVEVIKGVASALYGASALGGVVNLISRRPEDEATTEFLLNATTRNGQDLSAYTSGPVSDTWGYSFLGSVHRQEIQDLDDSGWADMPSYRRATARPRVFWRGQEGGSALLTVGGMAETREGGTLPGHTLPNGTAFEQSFETRRFDAGLTARHPLPGGRFLQLRASGMTMDRDQGFGDRLERSRQGTGFGEAAVTGSSGIHTWVLGTAVQWDGYRSAMFPDFDYSFTVPGLFGQSEWRFGPDMTVSASGRWDAHSEYGSHFSPRVSALYRPGEWTFRGSVGGGLFAPTHITEEVEVAGLHHLQFQPDVPLRAERARTASLDAGRTFGPLELNATLFGSRIEDAVQVAPPVSVPSGDDRLDMRVINIEGETRTWGTELLARLRMEDVAITGSYVFVRSTEPRPGPAERREVPLTPRHTGGLVAMWEDHDRGRVGLEAYYTGSQPLEDDPYRERGEPYVHLGLLGEIRLGRVSLFLNAENLLNERQTRHDPLVREQRSDGRWTVDAWGPIEGFVANGGVRVQVGGR